MLPGMQPPPNCFASDLQHQQLYGRCVENGKCLMIIGALPAE